MIAKDWESIPTKDGELLVSVTVSDGILHIAPITPDSSGLPGPWSELDVKGFDLLIAALKRLRESITLDVPGDHQEQSRLDR